MHIGQNIKALRTARGLTQNQLAEALGVSYQAVSKWETSVNTPDIALLPDIAALFGISIDRLFSADAPIPPLPAEMTREDGVIRIFQMRGRELLAVHTPDKNAPAMEIAFPRNCNGESQYFRVEVYGNLVADGSINGDVVAHQSLDCGDINGDVRCEGELRAARIQAETIHTRSVGEFYQLKCTNFYCGEEPKWPLWTRLTATCPKKEE